MAVENEKFGKAYKLCSVKEIETLFKKGKKVYKFPFSAHVKRSKELKSTPFQMVISVPKRNFKKAVDRNRLKRITREAVRKNKLILESFLKEQNESLSMILIYTHKEHLTFEEINDKTKVFFTQIINELQHDEQTI